MSRNVEMATANAERVLIYYIRTVWERSGLKWDSDNEAEVRGIVEDILQAGDQ